MFAGTREFHNALLCWYRAHRRDLPWRVRPGAPVGSLPEAYAVLVSEAMLQQTQVATVIAYFQRFMDELPTIHHLADADEQRILRLWQGLGYYSRARKLRSCAQMVVERFGGVIPDSVETLQELPGIGRYTAGAIASLAYGRRAPIVDGNVARVLCRLDCMEEDPRDRRVAEALWQRADELLPSKHVADYNSALMELGATICTPRQPKCLLCPVRANCAALAAGKAESIPPAKKAPPTKLNRRIVLCVLSNKRGKPEVLIEQRPSTGRWAGMWQFITTEAAVDEADIGLSAAVKAITGEVGRLSDLRPIARLQHQLTHRRYEFDVFAARAAERPKKLRPLAGNRRWTALAGLSDYPLPRPHLLIANRLAEQLAHLPPLALSARES